MEKETQKAILQYLNLSGHYCYRNNSGMVFSEYKGKKRMWSVGMKGSSDIIGIAKDGKFIAVEVKSKGNKPTLYQHVFLEEVRKRGGYAIVAYSLDDVMKIL